MDRDDHLEGQISNVPFLENLYHDFQAEPNKLDPSWSHFFQKLDQEGTSPISQSKISSKAERIAHLAEAYRRYGHLLANFNPIALEEPTLPQQLNLEKLGFDVTEKEEIFPTLGLLSQPEASLTAIEQVLQKRYCRTAGFEFKEFTDPFIEEWIQQQIESGVLDKPFSNEEKLLILDLLTRAEILETFLHTKHVGKKRFSLEGAETLIPMLAFLIAKGAEEGVEEFFIGMSHRGRLNVLANILDKPIQSILDDFDEDYEPAPSQGMGDIRYHKGYANEAVNTYLGKAVKLTMAPNPSHLESVSPVVLGQTHAEQFIAGDESDRNRIIPLLIHGDAALAGQGIVYETLQMRKLSGFETGGTIHFAVNNQIGFTTSPHEGRSTLYCTDIGRTFGIPVLHVNAEDPETCVRLTLFALELRQKFHSDVFIDFNCYRKYGHNEGDEPAFTQPLDYQIIRKKKSIRTLYLEQLLREEVVDKKTADAKEDEFKQHLQSAYSPSKDKKNESSNQIGIEETPISFQTIDTKVNLQFLQDVVQSFSKIPSDFHLHPKLEHLVQERVRSFQEDKPFDWGMGEFLAYGTLVEEGVSVRLAGQDSGRGTFSHRHAQWVDQINGESYYPLAHLKAGQGRFEVLNTLLSEAAALGFEYGYSTVCQGLTIWEAQFGDFVNSAQVIVDQYIASGEQKWGQTSELVLFLPHGFEGQGPEHSSARLERFLSLAGHDNMQIVNPTTPAQLFHLLRRQVKQPWRKPLVVMTPKGLLRFPASFSRVSDLTQGQFDTVLDDPRNPRNIRRVILCSGRIYYDLDREREKVKREDLAIIRIEQLYPLDKEKLKNMIAAYGQFKDCLWVQEEPENMGAWPYLSSLLPEVLPKDFPILYVGRERSATPATGFSTRHKQELVKILNQAFQS
jgi:2-oxoglutarate dehydrogenase E1 component